MAAEPNTHTTRVALIVGANRYEDPEIRDLVCAENDSIELTGFLKHAARFDRVELLHGPGATSEDVLNTAGELTSGLRPGDLFLFYFAGHGVEHGGRHLLLCPRARYARLRYMQQTVPVDLLREETDTPGLSRVFMLDACRSDLLLSRDVAGGGLHGEQLLRDVVARPATARADQVGSVAMLCSCAEGQQAGELADHGHGVFTAALLEVLDEALRAGAQVRLSDALESALADRMSTLARRHGLSRTQRPWIQRSGPPPILLPGRAESAPPPPPPRDAFDVPFAEVVPERDALDAAAAPPPLRRTRPRKRPKKRPAPAPASPGPQPTLSIHQAAAKGDIAQIRAHVEHGRDVNARADYGVTALHIAAQKGYADVAALLLDNGADATAVRMYGLTALHVAAQAGSCDVASLLLAHGLPPDVTDEHRYTPLHYACQEGHLDIAELLIEYGADVNARESSGKTPLRWAMDCKRTDTKRALKTLLQSRGARKN